MRLCRRNRMGAFTRFDWMCSNMVWYVKRRLSRGLSRSCDLRNMDIICCGAELVAFRWILVRFFNAFELFLVIKWHSWRLTSMPRANQCTIPIFIYWFYFIIYYRAIRHGNLFNWMFDIMTYDIVHLATDQNSQFRSMMSL